MIIILSYWIGETAVFLSLVIMLFTVRSRIVLALFSQQHFCFIHFEVFTTWTVVTKWDIWDYDFCHATVPVDDKTQNVTLGMEGGGMWNKIESC